MSERCGWAAGEELAAYHDEEWGRPVTDERGLYEKLCLEAFQSGLSWVTILRKREGFRAAFAGFDPDAVARFGSRDVERLMGDAAIVRNRAKIDAAIANARAVVGAARATAGLPALAWSFRVDARRAPRKLGDLPASTPGVDGAREGAEGARLPLRRPDDRVRPDAGVRPGERPRRRLLPAGRGRARAGDRDRPVVTRHERVTDPARSAHHAANLPG